MCQTKHGKHGSKLVPNKSNCNRRTSTKQSVVVVCFNAGSGSVLLDQELRFSRPLWAWKKTEKNVGNRKTVCIVIKVLGSGR